MKFEFKLGKADRYDVVRRTYVVPFSIIGGMEFSATELIEASRIPGGMRKIEQGIFAELSALLQVELYGRVLSNEQTPDEVAKDKRLLSSVQTDKCEPESQESRS